jgi:hypothetical protein
MPTVWLRGAIGSGSVERPALETAISDVEYYEPLARAGRQALRHLGHVTGPGDWELLDAMHVFFSVNGNPVTDPVGFRGHSLAATVFVVAAPRQAIASLRQIADALQLEPPKLVAEPLSLSAIAPSDGLIVHTGATMTNLILGHSRAPQVFCGVPQSSTLWMHTLMEAFNLSPARAEAAIHAFVTGRLSARNAEAMQNALQGNWGLWIADMIEILQSWREGLIWSPNIYLCGEAGAIPGLREALSRARWLDALPFSRTPETRIWDGSNVSQVSDLTKARWQLDSVTTLSLAAWAVRERHEQTPDGMLRASLELA